MWRARKPGCAHRLICFPHAGAGASAFAEWPDLLPPGIELVAVQPPGRQNRIAEKPFSEVRPLVNAVLHALGPEFGESFSFFGHSGGAALAYELTCALTAAGRPGPQHLFLSAQPPPGAAAVRRLHNLPDDEFLAEIIAFGGVDPELAADEDAVACLLPPLRADFRLWERHHLVARDPLDCAITVLCGDSDPRAPLTEMSRWSMRTTADFALRAFPGGHFYFHDAAPEVVSFIGDTMLAGRRS